MQKTVFIVRTGGRKTLECSNKKDKVKRRRDNSILLHMPGIKSPYIRLLFIEGRAYLFPNKRSSVFSFFFDEKKRELLFHSLFLFYQFITVCV